MLRRKGDPSLCTEGAGQPGPQLVWSGPGLVLVAAWLPRVTGVRSTVLPSHFWAAPLGRLVLVLAHYFFPI